MRPGRCVRRWKAIAIAVFGDCVAKALDVGRRHPAPGASCLYRHQAEALRIALHLEVGHERQAAGISLITNAALATGVFLWCVYGVLIASWPVIAANAVTLLFILAIVGLKLRYD